MALGAKYRIRLLEAPYPAEEQPDDHGVGGTVGGIAASANVRRRYEVYSPTSVARWRAATATKRCLVICQSTRHDS